MGRVLVIVLIVLVAVWLLRRALGPRTGARTSAPPTPIGGELVACARCGLNLPRAEAREAGGGLYCSDEHARLGRG